jgi:hypothetical protein
MLLIQSRETLSPGLKTYRAGIFSFITATGKKKEAIKRHFFSGTGDTKPPFLAE